MWLRSKITMSGLIPGIEPEFGGTMAGIGGFEHFTSPSGGLTSESPMYILTSEDIIIRTDIANLDTPNLIDLSTPSKASIKLNSDVVTIEVMAHEVLPWKGTSGVFLGNTTTPFSWVHTSGLYIKPIDSYSPIQPEFHGFTSYEGDILNHKATEQSGPGRLYQDTGSGIMGLSYGSGIYYGYFSKATSGVPNAVSPYGVIPWGTDRSKDQYFIHNPSNQATNTHVTVKLTGWYEIQYDVTSYKSANSTSATMDVKCVKNNTYTIPGTSRLAAALLLGHGNTATYRGIMYLNSMDQISVHVRELTTSAGDVILAANYSSLYMRYIGPGI